MIENVPHSLFVCVVSVRQKQRQTETETDGEGGREREEVGRERRWEKKKWGREERGGIVGMRETAKLGGKCISVTSKECITSKWAP